MIVNFLHWNLFKNRESDGIFAAGKRIQGKKRRNFFICRVFFAQQPSPIAEKTRIPLFKQPLKAFQII